jgi:fibronectin-binding autotransporter adhesin
MLGEQASWEDNTVDGLTLTPWGLIPGKPLWTNTISGDVAALQDAIDLLNDTVNNLQQNAVPYTNALWDVDLGARLLTAGGLVVNGDADFGGNNISNVSISADSISVSGAAVATRGANTFTGNQTVNGNLNVANLSSLSVDGGLSPTIQNVGGFLSIGNLSGGNGIRFRNSDGTEWARINNSGRMLLGTTTDDLGNRLQVAGGIFSSSNISAAGSITVNGGIISSSATGINLGRQGLAYNLFVQANQASGRVGLPQNSVIGWANNADPGNALTSGFSQTAANTVALGDGTAGNASGILNLATINVNGSAIGARSDVGMLLFNGLGFNQLGVGIGSAGYNPGVVFGVASGLRWTNDIPGSVTSTTLSQASSGVLRVGAGAVGNNADGGLLLTNLTASGSLTIGAFSNTSPNPHATINVVANRARFTGVAGGGGIAGIEFLPRSDSQQASLVLGGTVSGSLANGAFIQGSDAIATRPILVVRGVTTQSTFNLQEWQNSAGTVAASVGPTGNVTASGSNSLFGGIPSDGGTGARLSVSAGIYTNGFMWATGGFTFATGHTIKSNPVNGSTGILVSSGQIQLATNGPVIKNISSTGVDFLRNDGVTKADVVAGAFNLPAWQLCPSGEVGGAVAIRNIAGGWEGLRINAQATTTVRDNFVINGGRNIAEAGIVFQQSGVGQWQLYDAGGSLRLFDYGLNAEVMTVNGATGAATFNNGLTTSGTLLATNANNSGRFEVRNGTSGNLIVLGDSGTGNVTINNSSSVGGAISLQSQGTTQLWTASSGVNARSAFNVYNAGSGNPTITQRDDLNYFGLNADKRLVWSSSTGSQNFFSGAVGLSLARLDATTAAFYTTPTGSTVADLRIGVLFPGDGFVLGNANSSHSLSRAGDGVMLSASAPGIADLIFRASNTGFSLHQERMRVKGSTGSLLVNTTVDDGVSRVQINGNLTATNATLNPPATVTPSVTNGSLTFEATSNTSLTIKYRGSDGVVRSTVLPLS